MLVKNLREFAAVVFLGALLLFSAPLHLLGQALYGSIVGVVRDASGGVVPGAVVKATQTGTGQVRQTTTNDAGAYVSRDVHAARKRSRS